MLHRSKITKVKKSFGLKKKLHQLLFANSLEQNHNKNDFRFVFQNISNYFALVTIYILHQRPRHPKKKKSGKTNLTVFIKILLKGDQKMYGSCIFRKFSWRIMAGIKRSKGKIINLFKSNTPSLF